MTASCSHPFNALISLPIRLQKSGSSVLTAAQMLVKGS
jgi:hypothetical protein